MDNKEAMWFHANYNLKEFKIQDDIRTYDDGPITYQIKGDRGTATLTIPLMALERLVLNAKIGFDEIERARARSDYPNVQEAYDAYITLLALSTKYD